MPSVETLLWIAGAFATLVSALAAALWNMVRTEAKEQAAKIGTKADNERVHEMEQRWQADLVTVREGNEKLINKLEARHDREIEQMATRLETQIRNTETNILAQIQLMIKVMKSSE